jgi:lipase chaperone LimK
VRARLPLLLAAAVTAAGGALWLLRPATDATGVGPAREEAPARVSAAPAPGTSLGAPASGGLPALPASLAGTEPDGALVLDADGRFVPTRDALDLFDYFLSASGEEPDARIRARIEAAIRARLDDPLPALALLDQYLAYRAEVRALFEDAFTATLPLERRLQRIRELRRAHFGAELAEALFADEEARWRADVERLRVRRDPALDEDERAARLAALDAELPEPVREARAAATAPIALRRDERRLRAEGASQAEIDALREARFGPEAAARLATLDRARAEWDARVVAYREERDRLAAREGDDADARAAALDALRDARFSGAERLRIEALDRIEARASAAATSGADPRR